MNMMSALMFAAVEGFKAHVRRLYKRSEVVSIKIGDGLGSARTVVISPICNECDRLDAFLTYYRSIGVEHFIFVDNLSTDDTASFLRRQSDVSLFEARGRFASARYGIDWINHILKKYCVNKWIVHVDADEMLVFPHCETQSLPDLCRHLEAEGLSSLSTTLIDMYSDGDIAGNACAPGQNPLEICPLFDAYGYRERYNSDTRTTWIKGGVRGRIYFKDDIWSGPALNKTPLVLWKKSYAFTKSAHELWPWHLNEGARESRIPLRGALLHFKFVSSFARKVAIEAVRQQHTTEYAAYASQPEEPKLSSEGFTEMYLDSGSLLECGLMKGDGWPAHLSPKIVEAADQPRNLILARSA